MSSMVSTLAPTALWRRTRAYLALNPLLGVLLLVVIILGILILYPAWILFSSSFHDAAGAFTLAWYLDAYTDPNN